MDNQPLTRIFQPQNEDGVDLNLDKVDGYKRKKPKIDPDYTRDSPYHRDVSNHVVKGIV